MKAELKQYLEGILKDAGADEVAQQAILTTFENEKVSNAFIPRPEFSRALDEKDKTVKAKDQEMQNYYQQVLATTQRNEEAVRRAMAVAQRYVDTYGELPDGTTVDPNNPAATRAAVGDYVSKQDFQKLMAERDAQTIYLVKRAAGFSADYLHRFQKPLDMDALEKLAIEKKLSLDQAYAEYIGPEQQARQQTEFDAKLKSEFERGLKEGSSRTSVPTDHKPSEPHPFFDRSKADAKPTSRQVRDGFVEEWNKAGTTSQ